MAESSVWLVDKIAAEAIIRDLGLQLGEPQIACVAERLAEHRINTFDLGASRIQSKIATTVQDVVSAHSYRSTDWSEGCRSAEAAILTMASRLLAETKPVKQRSKGEILRTMVKKARSRAVGNPVYQVVE